MLKISLLFLVLIALGGCSKEERTQSSGGMKCGAGKCGANMFDSAVGVDKKKKNILSQMREDDPRKTCVLQAPTVKALYDCVRDPSTGRLSTQCGGDEGDTHMACGAGKCGGQMKCASGKCGGD